MASFSLQVVDSRGKTWRVSRHGYTHAIVIHMKAQSFALWQRSEALARRDAASWSKFDHVEAIEIIAAVRPPGVPG